jgi:hypothetical protein
MVKFGFFVGSEFVCRVSLEQFVEPSLCRRGQQAVSQRFQFLIAQADQ